jgi:hypothetical protein
MSMTLEFEPHSWYYQFAIQKDNIGENCDGRLLNIWRAYIDNGNTYAIDELAAPTLLELKQSIRQYWLRDGGKYTPAYYAKRLERAER